MNADVRISGPLNLQSLAVFTGLSVESLAEWEIRAARRIRRLLPEVPNVQLHDILFFRSLEEDKAQWFSTVKPQEGSLLAHFLNLDLSVKETYDACGNLMQSVILAGVHVTRTFLNQILNHLNQDPELWDVFRRQPDVIPKAIEEFLRYYSPSEQLQWLVAQSDFQQRKVVAGTYNKQPIQEFEPVIRGYVQRFIANIPKTKSFEFIQGVGKPLTLEIFIELAGLRREETTKIAEHARKFMSLVGLTTDWEPQAAELRGMQKVYENLWNHREEDPPSGLMEQIFGACDAGIMSYDEIMEMCVLVSIGTNETMTNLIGLCFMYLEMYPDIRKEVAESSDIWNAFIDEVIRIDGPVRSSSAQRAKQAIEIDGIQIKEGDLVYSVANHDPAAFENPREFNIHLKGVPHLGFGFGRHHCLGSHLAKSTMRIILEELHENFPDWRISSSEFPWHSRILKMRPPGPWAFLDWRNSQQIRGLETIHLDLSKR